MFSHRGLLTLTYYIIIRVKAYVIKMYIDIMPINHIHGLHLNNTDDNRLDFERLPSSF